MKHIVILFMALALVGLACGQETPRELVLYPSPTANPTQTPLVVQITTTPVYVVVSETPNASKVCVNALVAVHLRPSPSDENYPITVIPNGTELVDLGGRSGNWWFVSYQDKSGWVHSDFLGSC